MNRPVIDEKGELKSSHVKQEMVNYGYDPSSMSYSTTNATPSMLDQAAAAGQPLPGQPPLPPMPPPQAAAPPPPSVYGAVPTQVPQIHAWPHPATAWQWITPQVAPMPAQNPAAAFQREMPIRNTFVKRERFNHNRNSAYPQRGNFHRKNRRRFDQPQSQYDQSSYYNAALTNNMGAYNEALSGLHMSLQSQISHIVAAVGNARKTEDSGDQDIKEEVVVVKKNKQRKPMSQSYPSRPWNREDADRALKIENEFNKTVKAQSLIIKFPDPDLNKDIVREFHSGIQNIHFQSPSGPRYCFIQMAESVNIDEAIKELEKIPFGVGHLKVERKSLRDEDNPTPEEIDPYTLYIGNLPESVNVNEVKNKFPTAARVDVGYAQKMRNTRYAFIRYNSVDESIAAYKQAHDLMWDTRSIIVRFRRQRGNTCLPGETKPGNAKKNKEAEKVVSVTNSDQSVSKVQQNQKSSESINCTNSINPTESSATLISSDTTIKSDPNSDKMSKDSQIPQIATIPDNESEVQNESTLITEIKEEPVDYDDEPLMEEYYDDDDDDDDEDDDDHPGGIVRFHEEDSSSGYDDLIKSSEDNRKIKSKDDILLSKESKKTESKDEDDLDSIFTSLESTATEINY